MDFIFFSTDVFELIPSRFCRLVTVEGAEFQNIVNVEIYASAARV